MYHYDFIANLLVYIYIYICIFPNGIMQMMHFPLFLANHGSMFH